MFQDRYLEGLMRIHQLLLEKYLQDVSFDSAYLCGPEGMIKTVSNTLQDNGIDESKIFFELFTSSDEGTHLV